MEEGRIGGIVVDRCGCPGRGVVPHGAGEGQGWTNVGNGSVGNDGVYWRGLGDVWAE